MSPPMYVYSTARFKPGSFVFSLPYPFVYMERFFRFLSTLFAPLTQLGIWGAL